MKRYLLVILIFVMVPAISGAVEKDQHHCLWKATSPTGGIVYLLGSIHVLPVNTGPMPDGIESSFRKASTLVFEMDDEAMQSSGPALFAAGALPAGKKLEEVLSSDTALMLKKYLAEKKISISSLNAMRPWMAALNLTTLELLKLGYSPAAGVDISLARRAAAEGKEIIGLETPEEQISLFSGLSEAQSEAFLRSTIRDLRNLQTKLRPIIDSWQNGDTKKLQTLLGDALSEEPDILNRFVLTRNDRWMPTILSLFKKNHTSMVVVGTLHLIGDQGVLEKLRRTGIVVEQL